jgi:DNA primase
MTKSTLLIDQIKDRADIISSIGQVVNLKKTGKGYQGLCPFHKEKTPSFHVYENPARFYCFGCHEHGDILSFYQKLYQLSFPEAVKRLASELGIDLNLLNTMKEDESYAMCKKVLELAKNFYHSELGKLPTQHPAIEMLKNRQLRSEIIDLFQIGWAGYQKNLVQQWPKYKSTLIDVGLTVEQHLNQDKDRFINRLMFPIFSGKGEVLGFGGRIVNDDPAKKYAKYINSPETNLFKKNNILYGLNFALQHHQFKSFLIVEGYFDVIQLFNQSLPCAVAPMGTALTDSHVQLLLKYKREIIFCFDGDAAGQQASFKALKVILPYYSHLISVSFVTLPIDHDPDSYLLAYGRQSFIHLCQKRVRIGEYLFQQLEKIYPLDKIDNKVKFIAEAKALINLIQDPDARLTLLEVLRSMHVGYKNKLVAQQTIKKPVISKIKPEDILAAIFAKDPSLICELNENQKDILSKKYPNHGLKFLIFSEVTSDEFKVHQRQVLTRHAGLIDILPKDGLKFEVEQQLKNLGII